MATTRRMSRVAELIKREVSQMILFELKDDRVGAGMISITDVDVSGDLQHAKIFVSIYGSDGRQVLQRSLENVAGASLDIDLSEHPAGLYFVRLQAGKVGYTEKILLQKP